MFELVVGGTGAASEAGAETPATLSSAASHPTADALSRGRSFGLSAGSLTGLVLTSKLESEFELD